MHVTADMKNTSFFPNHKNQIIQNISYDKLTVQLYFNQLERFWLLTNNTTGNC